MSLPVPPELPGRLNAPRVAELVRINGIERLKCRWCGTWAEPSATGGIVCAACDGIEPRP